MGTTLTGTTPQDTYDSLIKVTDNGPISGTAKYLSDGLGNDSILALSTARVGLGTATPDAMLTLNGTTPYIRIERTGVPTWQIQNNTLVVDAGFSINNLTNAGTPFFINGTTNNVGIGTGSPASKLHVQSGALQVSGNSIDTVISYSTVGIVGTTTAHDLQIIRNSVEIARVTANGLTFNGDTAAANALDDYEEGTFTPSVAGATTAGTATYTQRVGVYTKIGRQVSVQIDLGWNSGTGTGLLTITGLPFADTSNTNPAITIGFFDGITLTASNYALAYIPSLSSTIDIVQTPVGGGSITSVPYDAAGRIILNVTYTA